MRARFRYLIMAGATVLLVAGPLCAPAQRNVFGERRTVPLLGTIEDALVGIEVTSSTKDDSVRFTRHGNGLILRPDGFILAPVGLFSGAISVAGSSEDGEKQAVSIVLYPGTDRERRVAGRPPRHLAPGVGYAVLKLVDTDTTALRTLLPDTLKPGDELAVCWSPWNGATHRFEPVQRRQATLAAPTAEEVDAHPGLLPFEQPQDGIPAGAVVLGPEGMAVGLVPGGGAAQASPAFWSMAALGRVTNCVTPLPIPDATFHALKVPEGIAPPPPMVDVPGGQFIPSVALCAEQPDLEGAITCTIAPFQIDKFQVTNEEYLSYWRTLPESSRRRIGYRSRYYPWTWAPYPADPPFPADLSKVPVMGVPLPGAMGYAAWRGKRLPTPYEWQLAALGPRGETSTPDWMQQYISDHQSLWQKLRTLHIGYLEQHRELAQRGALLGGWNQIPWISIPSLLLDASEWSKDAIDHFVDEQWARWEEPLYVRPVGSRDYDLSPYGAADMVMNGAELVMPTPGPPALGSARYMGISWIPEPLPTRADPWMPRKIDANTDGPPLQPISRLYIRKSIGPTLEELLMWSSLNESVQMITPLKGWQVAMTRADRTDVTMWPRGSGPYSLFGRPSGFDVWKGMPRHYRREMGREVPLEQPQTHPTPGPQLYYFLPTGFRCAR